MRILFCSSFPPVGPVRAGHQLPVDRLLAELRQRHVVRMIAPWRERDGRPPAEVEGLRLVMLMEPGSVRKRVRATTRAVGAWARLRPATLPPVAPALREAIAVELEDFDPDVVHVTLDHLAELGRELSDWPSVLVPLDARHLNVSAKAELKSGASRAVWRCEAALMKRFAARVYPDFDRVVTVSAADARALEALNPRLVTSVIPNGVDSSRFSHDGRTPRQPGRLLFTGVMNVAPNIAAALYLAREILPAVRSRLPEASLAIVGRRPSPWVRELGEAEGVEVPGEVPDLRPWLSGASVFVCPMVSGTGIKNKLLEALANGLP